MHINRGLLFWGLALVTAGVVALATTQGWIDLPPWVDLWTWWPIVLIAIGVAIVLSRTQFAVIGVIVAALVVGLAGGAAVSAGVGGGFGTCSDVRGGTQDTANGEFTSTTASVELDMNCGDLTVGLADGSTWQAITTTEDGEGVSLSSDSGSLQVRSTTGDFPLNQDRQDWAVTLGRDVEYDLSLTINAFDGQVDLTDGRFTSVSADPNAGSLAMTLAGSQVQDFDVQLNAGSVSILTDTETQLAGRVGVNAGSVELCTDPDAGVRISVEDTNITFSHNLEGSGLQQSGDTYTSANFESAAQTIDLRVEGNAASFTLNPEEGCS